MVGENFDLGAPPDGYIFGDVALSIQNLSVATPGGSGYDAVDRLSLDVNEGEIVCIYGLMGAGRTEMMECIAGRLKPSGGKVTLHGRDLAGLSIAQRIGAGLVLTPEDRQRDGLVQTMTVGPNLALASIASFTRGLFTSHAAEQEIIDRSIRDVTVKTDGGGAAIGSLSGGNQQKVVIGKMLATGPSVVLLDEPSRGMDIGAKAEVFRLLADGARKGLAAIYSTSEVSECLSIAHRIIVMHKGWISASFGPDATKEQIMAASGEVDLQQTLTNGFGLKHCEVVAELHQDDLALETLGAAGARFLSAEIASGQNRVIGAGYGRTLQACVEHLAPQKTEDLTLVSLMGALNAASDENPHAVVARLASLTGANAGALHRQHGGGSRRASGAAGGARSGGAGSAGRYDGCRHRHHRPERRTGRHRHDRARGNGRDRSSGRRGRNAGAFLWPQRPACRTGDHRSHPDPPTGSAAQLPDRRHRGRRDQKRSHQRRPEQRLAEWIDHRRTRGPHDCRPAAPTAPRTDTEIFDMTDGTTTKTPAARGLLASAFGENTNLVQILLEGRAFFALIAIIAIFSFLSPNYATLSNFLIMANHVAIFGLLSIGMLLVILNGGTDLSVGSVLGLNGVFAGFLMQGIEIESAGVILYPPVWVVVVLTLALGAFVGAVNGVLIAVFRVPAFVATLGSLYVARGVALLMTNGLTFNNLSGDDTLGNTGFEWLGFYRIGGVPVGVIVLALAAIVAGLLLARTTFGRWLYSSGGNARAAELSGVPVKRVQISVYVLSGICAAIAGLVLSSQLTSAGPTAGATYELTAIAAVVVGGASLMGGCGTVRGTLLGAFFIGFLSDGLVIIGVSSYWQTVFTGAVIVLAVMLNSIQYGGAAKRS